MKRIAHRGATNFYPENTLESLNKAVELGFDGIECDVRRTSDGKLVLMHDSSIDRTTNGNGLIAQLSSRDLQRVRVGDGYRVPTVSQVIEQILPKTWVNFELKEADKSAAIEISAQVPSSLRDNVLISSKRAGALAGNIKVARAYIHPIALVGRFVAKKLALDAVVTRSWPINRLFLRKAARQGLKVFLYHPMGARLNLDKTEADKLEGLITDEDAAS